MGNVSGRLEDSPALYLRDQWRLSIASLEVTNAQNKVLLRITPNGFPCTKVTARKEPNDESLVEFVQDSDPTASNPFLIKLPFEDELYLRFTFIVRGREDAGGATPVNTIINGLTFIAASTSRDLENLITREFHADPNLHKNPNVHLLGDYSTDRSPPVQFEYKWRWKPPLGREERLGGWRNTCSFVEYDQRAHKLSMLAIFSFWVQNKPRASPPTPTGSPKFALQLPPKLALGSKTAEKGNSLTDHSDIEPPSPLVDSGDNLSLATTVTNNVPAVKVDNCPRPVDTILGDDGPLFRATMKSLEQKTSTLRLKMKKVLKKAEQARQAQMACNEATTAFMESLREASTSGNEKTGIQPALDHYFERTYREILSFERQNETNLQKLIIEPLNRLYQTDLKQAESKKRDFEEESRDYYNYVSRYLGIRSDSSKEKKEKKKAESESKYQTKRKNFELKRFDYSTFMQDLHGGRKEQEVLSQLTKFADAQARGFLKTAQRVQGLLPELDALNHEVKQTAKEFQLQRTEREERRRQLEKNDRVYVEPDGPPSFFPPTTPNPASSSSSDILGYNTGFERLGPGTSSVRAVSSGSEGGGVEGGLSTYGLGLTSTSAPPNPNAGSLKYRAFAQNDSNGAGEKESDRRKEGLLWALSRPGSHVDPKGLNKQAWHKYWVVLAGGQLCEYSNWKQKLDLHNDPINLRMASVREARNSDRRFCFEVVTPQYKRVYQATSEEDMNNWIMSINNAVKSTIEGSGSVRNFNPAATDDPEPSQLKNIQSALTGKSPHHHHSVHGTNPLSSSSSASNNIYRRTTVGARPTYIRRNSSNFGDDPEKLLQIVREADPGNSCCADCGSQVKTEWVSINLGIVLCIECSGLHRSLGTHISKVRSLTLDVTSFTPDLVDLLSHIGNRVSNSVWEANIGSTEKPGARASREARLKFINAKYVDRAYVAPLSPPFTNPDEQLLDAVKRNNPISALHALVLKADPNIIDPETSKFVLLLALLSSDAATSANNDLPPPSPGPQNPITYPLAELLMQNGAEIPAQQPLDGLSPAAKTYIAQKTAKRLGQQTTPTKPAREGNTMTLKERQQREKERLQKRVSSGARLHRAPGLQDRSWQ